MISDDSDDYSWVSFRSSCIKFIGGGVVDVLTECPSPGTLVKRGEIEQDNLFVLDVSPPPGFGSTLPSACIRP